VKWIIYKKIKGGKDEKKVVNRINFLLNGLCILDKLRKNTD